MHPAGELAVFKIDICTDEHDFFPTVTETDKIFVVADLLQRNFRSFIEFEFDDIKPVPAADDSINASAVCTAFRLSVRI